MPKSLSKVNETLFMIQILLTQVGDGVYDDTFGLNLLLSVAAGANRPLFIPMGSYIVTDTIKASP